MSLCTLMQLDFMEGTGRFDDSGAELYDDNDLAYGYQYALDYLAAGEVVEPLMKFDLSDFADWCRKVSKCDPCVRSFSNVRR